MGTCNAHPLWRGDGPELVPKTKMWGTPHITQLPAPDIEVSRAGPERQSTPVALWPCLTGRYVSSPRYWRRRVRPAPAKDLCCLSSDA